VSCLGWASVKPTVNFDEGSSTWGVRAENGGFLSERTAVADVFRRETPDERNRPPSPPPLSPDCVSVMDHPLLLSLPVVARSLGLGGPRARSRVDSARSTSRISARVRGSPREVRFFGTMVR